MSANDGSRVLAQKAQAHLVRYGGAFAPLIAESAAGNYPPTPTAAGSSISPRGR